MHTGGSQVGGCSVITALYLFCSVGDLRILSDGVCVVSSAFSRLFLVSLPHNFSFLFFFLLAVCMVMAREKRVSFFHLACVTTKSRYEL
jgi:hypothetical protein